jgi:6-phosphofructokinase 1
MRKNKIESIAVFCSGGDAPGMNAAIRSVVLTALDNGITPLGIIDGYDGMIDGNFKPLNEEDVRSIIHLGGSILRSARSKRFLQKESRVNAVSEIKKKQVDGLIAIGGDGTFRGAMALSQLSKIPIVGIPATIDNNLNGTDFTIGFDTALNTVVEASDRIRDTATTRQRIFFIEVMGRNCGDIALMSAVATGAQIAVVPEYKTDLKKIEKILRSELEKGISPIVIVSEGDEIGNAEILSKQLKNKFKKHDIAVSVLSYIQRGGNPSCADRVLATRMGVAAVSTLLKGGNLVMMASKNNFIVPVSLKVAVKKKAPNYNLFKTPHLLIT